VDHPVAPLSRPVTRCATSYSMANEALLPVEGNPRYRCTHPETRRDRAI